MIQAENTFPAGVVAMAAVGPSLPTYLASDMTKKKGPRRGTSVTLSGHFHG